MDDRKSFDKGLDEERMEEAVAVNTSAASKIAQQHADLYAEALAKYGVDGDIDPAAEKRVKRKLDRRILPALGICYFFYVSSGYACVRHDNGSSTTAGGLPPLLHACLQCSQRRRAVGGHTPTLAPTRVTKCRHFGIRPGASRGSAGICRLIRGAVGHSTRILHLSLLPSTSVNTWALGNGLASITS